MPVSFSPEQLQYIQSKTFTFLGYYEKFPEEMGTRTFESIGRARRRRRPESALPHVEVTDDEGGVSTVVEPATEEEWWEYIQNAELNDELAVALDRVQTTTEWTPSEPDLPVGLVFSGDWHLGARGVNTRALDAWIDTVANTPGLGVVLMGDYMEGVTTYDKARGSLYSGAYNSPSAQQKSLSIRLNRFRQGQIKAMLSGNHDEMFARHTGLYRVPTLAKLLGCPHFGEGGGTIYVNVGSERYVIGVKHQFGGKAPTVLRKMVSDHPGSERLHVAVLAHLHFTEAQSFPSGGGRAWGLRCGTYKLDDEYARRNGFVPQMGTPMVILDHGREYVRAYSGEDFESGLAELKRLRGDA